MSVMYEDEAVARGYAQYRPALHQLIMARVQEKLGWRHRSARALDVGCGCGLSTAPLSALAERSIGLEPSLLMLQWARLIAPGGTFICGNAVHLPFPGRFFDLITAAGSLNYVDLTIVLPELERVMTVDGTLVIYDFSQGRTLLDSDLLDLWFETFMARYPPANDGWRAITRESLENDVRGIRVEAFEPFTMTLGYDAASYVNYVMTEANIQQAIRNGKSVAEIRQWCEQGLSQVFAGKTKPVLFQGYVAYLQL